MLTLPELPHLSKGYILYYLFELVYSFSYPLSVD
nr:MAG TPA: hypothetical protein [Bacteriophage sp.]